MFCKNCGSEMLDGVKFCSKCGTEQVYPNNMTYQPNNKVMENGGQIKNYENANPFQNKENSKNKPGIISYILVIAIVIAILWAAIAGVRWAFSTVGSWLDEKDGTGKQASERIDARDMISSYE